MMGVIMSFHSVCFTWRTVRPGDKVVAKMVPKWLMAYRVVYSVKMIKERKTEAAKIAPTFHMV